MLTDDQQKQINDLCQTFKGQIPLDCIAEGIRSCILNAQDLLEDGMLLFNAERYPRAMSIFISTMEEIGKISTLCSMARVPKENQALWKEFWKNFRSHQYKSTAAFTHTYADEARQHPEVILSAAVLQEDLSELTERFRQAGLYVDFYVSENRWILPAEITSAEATKWKQRAETSLSRVQAAYNLGLYSEPALLIQREVFGPLNATRPRQKELGAHIVAQFQQDARALQKQYWKRLVERGVLPIDSDVQVMGVQLRDLIGADEQC